MQTDSTPTQRMVFAEIRAQILHYAARDRELTNQLADMYKAKKSGAAPTLPVSDRQKSARSRAKELLNGSAAHILPPAAIASPGDEESLFVERDAVRIILDALQKQGFEAEAFEAAQWASENHSKWMALCRDRVLATIRLNGADERIEKFLNAIDPARRAALNLSWSWWEMDAATIAQAISEGVVTSLDASRARRGKGQPDGE